MFVLNVAVAVDPEAVTATVAIVTVPSKNVTDPVGAAVPLAGVTVAVNVILLTPVAGKVFELEVTPVVVSNFVTPLVTVTLTFVDVEVA